MRVLIVGDFCPQNRVAELFENRDYASVLGGVKQIIENVDYSIVNFECPVTKGNEKAINKLGPNLKCSEDGIRAVKWMGFDCVTLANNHFLDFSEGGVKNTLVTCEKYGIDTVGGGMNLREASAVLYKRIGEKILAIINCCESEFSIATDTTAGSNALNPIQQYYAIKEACTRSDFVLVIVHGGHEFYQLPSPRMKEIYHFFVDAGADAVVNHHQHCFSGYEIYHNKPIFYGLGNFCFDKKGTLPLGWTEGYMVNVNFQKGNIGFSIIPYKQCGEKPKVELMPDKSYDNRILELNQIIEEDGLLKKHTEKYYYESMKEVAYTIEPIQNRYIAAMQHRHLLPSSWSKKWLVKLQNYISCDAHRDKLLYFVKHFEP